MTHSEEAIEAVARVMWAQWASESWDERIESFPDSADIANIKAKAVQVLDATVPFVGNGMPLVGTNSKGFIRGQYIYPKLMHKIADLCQALAHFEAVSDPDEVESDHFFDGRAQLPIYNLDDKRESDKEPMPVGWIVCIDEATWVFAPNKECEGWL